MISILQPLNIVVGDSQRSMHSLKNVTLRGQPDSFLQMAKSCVSGSISPRYNFTLFTSKSVCFAISSARDFEKVILNTLEPLTMA